MALADDPPDVTMTSLSYTFLRAPRCCDVGSSLLLVDEEVAATAAAAAAAAAVALVDGLSLRTSEIE